MYVGLDIHKRSWNAAIYLNEQFIRNIHQPPTPQALHHYLQHNYRQAKYVCAYECGKFGYCIQREFKQLGIECLVVNPADIPSTHKDEVYKTDSRDARGIRQALSSGQLKSIYVPYEDQEADRHLVRQRKKIWRDLIRCKNRIKGFLDYTGTEAPAQYDNANWSRNFINWLSKIEFDYSSNRVTLNYQITEMELLRKELLSISNTI